jgi:hypothetical protein
MINQEYDEYYNDPIEPDEPTIKWNIFIYCTTIILLTILCVIGFKDAKSAMREVKHLQGVIEVYDRSDKVYKDLTVYGSLEIVGGDNLTFMGISINCTDKNQTGLIIK